MPRLMDVDVFKKNLDKEFETATDAFDAVDFALEDTPTIDAVPVTRCVECKHSREKNEDERKYLIEGILICTSPDATDNCWNPVFENHFCSYGEPRGERKKPPETEGEG